MFDSTKTPPPTKTKDPVLVLLRLLCVSCTWFDLHGASVGAGLSFAVCDSQGEAVLPLHQVSEKQHGLVVRVVQHVLMGRERKC